MTTAALLAAVLQYGPTMIPLLAKLVQDVEAGKGDKQVTAADFAELSRLSTQTAADIYRRLDIIPPPPA